MLVTENIRKHVIIVGPRRIEHELMASFLESRTGALCKIFDSGKNTATIEGDREEKPMLVLWDCLGRDKDECLGCLDNDLNHLSTTELVALFNVQDGMGIEDEALGRGVRGFFYEQDNLEKLAKGVNALFLGELWVSREVTARFIIERGLTGQNRNHKELSDMTQREIEILKLVAVGSTNGEIADELNISPHTVRTHLHNIFKKIHVPNRLQAALWVANNL